MKIRSNGISFEVEETRPQGGDERGVVVLVTGLGLQLVSWPPAFVRAFAQAGFRVIAFDNRDIGLSQHFDHLGVPNIAWESFKRRVGLKVRAPYSIQDMAADTLGVMDAMHVERAHVVGLSMGGMIAQRVAMAAPDRVASLTSIMSSSGAKNLPGPRGEVLRVLLGKPDGQGEDAIVNHTVKLFRVIGSPGFPMDETVLREKIVYATRRSHHPQGVLRQMTAIVADTRRAADLSSVRVPTLVVHGKDDPLVPFACGEDTAERIPGACLFAVPGMGHDLPPGVVDIILQPVLSHIQGNTPVTA